MNTECQLNTEAQKARVRALTAPARAEGRDYTSGERRALLRCLGEDVTGRLDAAASRRLAALLLAAPGAGEPTRHHVARAWGKPTERERFRAMLLIAVVRSGLRRGMDWPELEGALCAPDGGGEPLTPAEMTRGQRQAWRNWRLLNRLVPLGCVRRREL